MPNYKEMYYTLFRAMARAKEILEEAEKQTEEVFMQEEGPNWIELGKHKPDP